MASSELADANGFIGRTAEIDALRSGLATSRFVLVVGPGGAGKTRLARRYMEQHGGTNGLFCDLSTARSKADVLGAVSTALDVGLGAGDTQAAAERIGLALAARAPCLVVLDNLETIGDGVEAIAAWAGTGPSFLATSRIRFPFSGAIDLELGPLPEEAAVELFVRRARVVAPEFVADAATRALVARLYGSPLAIELAAARTHVLSPAALLERFGKHLDLLRSTSTALPERHRSVRAVIEGSWALSNEEERRALARASVFRGGFDLVGAEAVIGDDAADRIEALLDSSLVHRSAATSGTRFALYDSVREFAAERLAEDVAVRRDAESKHAAHYRALAVRFAERLINAEPSALAMHALESENLLASFRAEPRSALAFAPVLNRALPHDAHAAALTRGLALLPDDAVADRAEMELALARAVRSLGRGLEALEHAERGVALADRTNRPDIVVDADYMRAQTLFDVGRLAEARASAARAAELGVSRSSPAIAARSLDLLGWIAIDEGDFAQASRFAEQSLGIAREHGFQLLESFAENLLGASLARRGELAASEAHLERGLALARALGHRIQEAIMLGNLAKALMLRGESARARELFEQTILLTRAIGAKKTELTQRTNLALVDADLGRLADARAGAAHVERLATEMHQPRQGHGAALLLGSIALEEGRIDEARSDFERALAAAEALKSAAGVATALGGLAAASAIGGAFDEASAFLARAGEQAAAPDSEASAVVRARAATVGFARAAADDSAARPAIVDAAEKELLAARTRADSSVEVRVASRLAAFVRDRAARRTASSAQDGASAGPASSRSALAVQPRFELVTRTGIVLADALPPDADLAFDALTRAVIVDGGAPLDLRAKPVAARLIEVVLAEPGATFDKPRLYEAVWHAPFRTLSQGSAVYKAVVRLGALLDLDPRRFLRWDETGGLVLAAKRPALLRAMGQEEEKKT